MPDTFDESDYEDALIDIDPRAAAARRGSKWARRKRLIAFTALVLVALFVFYLLKFGRTW